MKIVSATEDDELWIECMETSEGMEQNFMVHIAGHVLLLKIISVLDQATSEILIEQVESELERAFP